MALDLDPTLPARRPSELRHLVDAVLESTPEDEQDWLEWKGPLDLSTKADQFKVAKTILGMANRDPGRAERYMGGLGYIVVGASPGSLQGVGAVDTADLDNSLSPFLGDQGPAWSAHRVSVEDKDVLVVVVEAPPRGQPGFSLRRSFHPDQGGRAKGAGDGTIFVRSGTKTRPATSADHDMLHRRAAEGSDRPIDGPPISVQAIRGGALGLSMDETRALLEEIADQRSEYLIQTSLARTRDRSPENLAALVNTMRGISRSESWEDYVERVGRWADSAVDAACEELLWISTERGAGQIGIAVTNDSMVNLREVKVSLILSPDDALIAFDDLGAAEPDIPVEPPLYSPNLPLSYLSSGLNMPGLLGPLRTRSGDVYVDRYEDGSTQITYDVGDLRPHDKWETDAAFFVALTAETAETATSTISASWTATSTSRDGVRAGAIDLPIARSITASQAAGLTTLGKDRTPS